MIQNEIRINHKKDTIKSAILIMVIFYVLSVAILIYSIYLPDIFIIIQLIPFLIVAPLTMYLFLVKIMFSKVAIIISEKGIYDNSNISSLGFIAWQDVESIRENYIFNQNVIVLIMRSEKIKEYIRNEKNFIKKLLMKLNYESCGTLVTIFEKSIDYNFEEFKSILKNHRDNFYKNELNKNDQA